METKTNKNNGTSPGPGTTMCLCIHWLKGRTEIPKTCIMNYHCERCAFDQWLDELDHLDAQFYLAA